MKVMVDTAFPDHRKVADLSIELEVDDGAAVGYVLTLWCRAMALAPSGSLEGWSDVYIARSSKWPRDYRVFVKALLKVGFLTGSDGKRSIKDWVEWQGDVVKKRHDWARRKANLRESRGTPTETPVGTPARVSEESAPPYPSRPVPSLPYPSPPGGDVPPSAASPGDATTVQGLAKAANEVDPTIPVEKAEYHVRAALTRGVKPDEALEAIRKRCPAERLWHVLDSLAPARLVKRAKDVYRPTVADSKPPAGLREARAEAVRNVDAKLAELPPETLKAWEAEALESAKAGNVPPDRVKGYVQAQLRLRAAKKYGIEGV